MSRDKTLYDVIVIGLGGVGSFALRSLAKGTKSRPKKPLKILGLERFSIGHELGSSHGHTRLYRHAYFEHPSYVPLCLKSTEAFRELTRWKQQDAASKAQPPPVPLLEECGVLVVSDGGKDGTYEIIERCSESARQFRIPVRVLEAPDLEREYGSCFAIDGQPPSSSNLRGLLEPGAGFVRPELAVRYAVEEALGHGAKLREGVQVVGISPETSPSEGPVCTVETSDGTTYATRGVIVSAGAWASGLLPELDPFLSVTRQVQAWFELLPSDDDGGSTTTLPPVGWYLDRARDDLGLYGIPADPFSSEQPGRSKIALHGRTVPFDPDRFESDHDTETETLRRPEVTQDELDELTTAAKGWIPTVTDESIVDARACLYTMTPDEDFVVDQVRNSSDGAAPTNVWYAAGLSGHGFKMTPALGEALADLVLTGETELPVDFLSKDRLLSASESSTERTK